MVPSIKSHTGTHHSPSARGHRVTAQQSLGIHLCVCVSGLLGSRITLPTLAFIQTRMQQKKTGQQRKACSSGGGQEAQSTPHKEG